MRTFRYFLALMLISTFTAGTDAHAFPFFRFLKRDLPRITRERDRYTYQHVWESPCTGENVDFTTTVTTTNITLTKKKSTKNWFKIALSSSGTGQSSGLRYWGSEKATVRTIEREATTDQVITIDLAYYAQGSASDLKSHQLLHIFIDADGNTQILAEESETSCS